MKKLILITVFCLVCPAYAVAQADMSPPVPVAPAMAPVAMAPDDPAMAPAAPAMAPVAAPAKAEAVPAKVAEKPKESGLDKADRWIGLIVKMLLGLLAIIGAVVSAIKGVEWRKALKSGRWAKILEYARKYAFPAVESIAKSTAWKGDDKLAEFLGRLDDWLEGEGDNPLSAMETKNIKREAADMAAAEKADDPDRPVDEKAVTRRKA
jgi:hypothetical protein